MPRPSYHEAQARYQNRYTMDHVPNWAKVQAPNGLYYAPQYRTDQEWFRNTVFYGEPEHYGRRSDCNSSGQTWPLGQWLEKPFKQ